VTSAANASQLNTTAATNDTQLNTTAAHTEAADAMSALILDDQALGEFC
jgi:hypothetical protein